MRPGGAGAGTGPEGTDFGPGSGSAEGGLDPGVHRDLRDEFGKRGRVDAEYLSRKGWTKEELKCFVEKYRELDMRAGQHPDAGRLGGRNPAGRDGFSGPVLGGAGGASDGQVDPGSGGGGDEGGRLTGESYDRVSPEYRELVKKFFQRLAEEGNR